MKAQAIRERDWQAESDAQSLRTAEEIKRDPARLKRAVSAAKKLYQRAAKEAEMTRMVSNFRMPKTAGGKK